MPLHRAVLHLMSRSAWLKGCMPALQQEANPQQAERDRLSLACTSNGRLSMVQVRCCTLCMLVTRGGGLLKNRQVLSPLCVR